MFVHGELARFEVALERRAERQRLLRRVGDDEVGREEAVRAHDRLRLVRDGVEALVALDHQPPASRRRAAEPVELAQELRCVGRRSVDRQRALDVAAHELRRLAQRATNARPHREQASVSMDPLPVRRVRRVGAQRAIDHVERIAWCVAIHLARGEQACHVHRERPARGRRDRGEHRLRAFDRAFAMEHHGFVERDLRRIHALARFRPRERVVRFREAIDVGEDDAELVPEPSDRGTTLDAASKHVDRLVVTTEPRERASLELEPAGELQPLELPRLLQRAFGETELELLEPFRPELLRLRGAFLLREEAVEEAHERQAELTRSN